MLKGTALAIVFGTAMAINAMASDTVIGNWNIQTLIYPGDPKTVFPDDHVRSNADYADLKRWRDMIGADIVFLQEVTSPAAIDAVFPATDGWQHCISGQYARDEGLNGGPICTESGEDALKPTVAIRTQYVALAWKTGASVTLDSIEDYQALDVKFLDGTQPRNIRWGLDAKFTFGDGSAMRVLNVHLKSGCFDDYIDYRLWSSDPALGSPTTKACDTLGQQMFPLRKWIEARENADEAWLIVGDFNRRLDAQSGAIPDEVWTALTGYSANKQGIDRDPRPDIAIYRQPYANMSVCWREFRNPNPAGVANPDDYNILPIEFFVYGKKAAALVIEESEKQFPWPAPTLADKKRLSDHCPATILLR